MSILRKTGLGAVIALAAFAVWVAVRVNQNKADAHTAAEVVRDLGGKMGSIPVLWTAEYRISFHESHFSKDDLRRLTVLNSLAERNWVGVAFNDTNLTREDILELRELMPRCVIFRKENRELVDEWNQPKR